MKSYLSPSHPQLTSLSQFFFPLNVSNSAQEGLSLSGDFPPNNSYLGCLECANAYPWCGQMGGSRGVWCRESSAQRSNSGSPLMNSQVYFLPASSFLLCLLNQLRQMMIFIYLPSLQLPPGPIRLLSTFNKYFE